LFDVKILILATPRLLRLVESIAGRVSNIFGLPVEVGEWDPGVSGSGGMAEEALALVPRIPGAKVVGVVEEDVTVPGLNFVFGLAELGGSAAVVSVYRLSSASASVLRERLLKEVVHELGHTFGLRHCPNPSCVMSFSNSVLDVDRKGPGFCPRCRERLLRLMGK